MRFARQGTTLLVLAVLVCGCGDGRLRTRGRIVKGGAPFHLGPGEGLRIVFMPVETSGPTYDFYAAIFNSDDGSFQVAGKDGKGMPPGKYRVALEHLKKKQDLFKGVFSEERTPIVREVTGSSQEVVIDLDKPGP